MVGSDNNICSIITSSEYILCTFGPAFPVGPLGPLSPRGPLGKDNVVKTKERILRRYLLPENVELNYCLSLNSPQACPG